MSDQMIWFLWSGRKMKELGWKSGGGVSGAGGVINPRDLTVGVLGVPFLTRSVSDQVRGPTKKLLQDQVAQDVERRISDRLLELLLPGLGNVESVNLGFLLDLADTGVRPRAGHKDFVPGHVSRRGVVTRVRDSPRVIRDQEGGMQDPSDSIVDRLGRGKGLVSALVGDDPETGAEKAHGDGDEGVCGGTDDVVAELGQAKAGDGRVDVEVCPGEQAEGNDILDDVEGRSDGRSVETVGGDGVEQLLDGELGRHKLFLFCHGACAGLLLFLLSGGGEELVLFGLAGHSLS